MLGPRRRLEQQVVTSRAAARRMRLRIQYRTGVLITVSICVIGGAAQTLSCLPNHLVKVPKGIRWLVYFGEVLSLVRLTGRLIKYS